MGGVSVRRDGGRGERGFTLVEVMVACAIIGIATTLAVPNFIEWQTRNKLRQATSEVATQLTLARMVAMNQNRGVNVTVTNVGDSVNISGVTSSASVSVLNEVVASKGITVNGNPITVSFSSMGLRTSGGASITTIGICNAQKLQYSVTVIPAGKVNWSTTPSATPCS